MIMSQLYQKTELSNSKHYLLNTPTIIYGSDYKSLFVDIQIEKEDVLSNFVDVDKPIMVKRDNEKQFIEIDFDKMGNNIIYLVKYHDTQYAIQKISEHEFATYEVQ